MIDLPVHHETPITPPQVSSTAIDLIEALEMLSLETYLKDSLKDISLEKIVSLPSGNQFKITKEGIRFLRTQSTVRELREISAKKTAAGHVRLSLNDIKYTTEGLQLWVDVYKHIFTPIKVASQDHTLPRSEMTTIFTDIDNDTCYTRANKKKPDGSSYAVILEVTKKTR